MLGMGQADETLRDGTSAPSAGEAGQSVLSADLVIEGDLTSKGFLEIRGQLAGNVTARGIVVGDDADVTGKFKAGSVTVKGKFGGEIEADTVQVNSSARVKADITYGSISIEKGALVDGRLSGVPRSTS